MITINLLPQKRRARISHIHLELFWVGVFFVCLFVGMGGGYYFVNSHIANLEATKNQRQAVKSALLVKVGKVNKLKKELEGLEVNVEAIRTIRVRQGLPVRYTDEVVSHMPEEKIWLESFTLNDKGGIEMKGVALDNQAFAHYVNALRQSPFIASVITRRTQLRPIQNLELVEFQCSVSAQAPETKENGDD
ncbi:PilN domain-containing protein [Desulfoplanes sp. PS50]